MRVHLLSVPNTEPTHEYPLDGFCLRTILFAELCDRLGHQVVLYGVERTDAPGTFVKVMSKAQQQALLGPTPPEYQYVSFDAGTPLFQSFNKDVQNLLRWSKEPGDILATIAGSAQAQIADAHPELPFLEYSIGYQGIAPMSHRVFESHAWRHVVHGFSGILGSRAGDAVIPLWYHAEQFPVSARPESYVIYCGRLVPSKGIRTACDAAKRAGVKLLLVGHGDPALVTYGEYLGPVSNEERNRLLSRATACLMPTEYIEPFGGVAAEAQLCGTPVIASDMGGFTDSVEHGESGYRCASLDEYVEAINLAPALDRAYVRRRAEALFSFEAAEVSYRAYFHRLAALRGIAPAAVPEGVYA